MSSLTYAPGGNLTLKRRQGEAVIVGDRLVTVTVLSISDGAVKLRFGCADRNLSVHREEIYLKLNPQKETEK
jgi:carbon storage regulator CsrA